jgi:sn-glycerol 3-phosphate transport system substrate-binding protein
VAITYWKSLVGPRHDAQVTLTDAFNAGRGDVRVTLEHAGEYSVASEKLRVALAAGTPPDVMMLGTNSDMPAFARIGALHPLDELARRDERAQLERYYPGFLRDSRYSGALYQLPFARSTPVVFANRDLLRASGLPEVVPATWAEFLTACRQLVRARAPGGESVGGAESELASPEIAAARAQQPGVSADAAYGVGTSWWEFQPMLWAFGGAFSGERLDVRIDTPASIEAMQFLADLVHRHRVAIATKAAQSAFLRGEIAFLTASTANLTQIEDSAFFRVGLGFMPAFRRRAVPGGGAGLSILRSIGTKQKEAGWEFLTFMTTATNAAYFAQATGYTPVRPDAMADPVMVEFLRKYPNARTAFDQIEHVFPTDSIIATPFANRHIEQALSAILFDGAAVPQVCADLATTLRQNAAQA